MLWRKRHHEFCWARARPYYLPGHEWQFVTVSILPTDSEILFLLCDVARQEPGGKVTLLGYFGGNEIKLNSNTPLPTILTIAAVYVLQDGEGKFSSSLSVVDSTRNQIMAGALPDIDKPKGNNHTIIINFPSLPVVQMGEFSFILTIGSKQYQRKLRIS